MQFAVYISDPSVTVIQNQGHGTKNDNVDPKQGYNHAKCERFCFNGVQEKANFNFSFRQGNMSLTFFEYVHRLKIVVYS